MIDGVTRPEHDWDAAYQGSHPAPWDTGRPQRMFVDLAEQGRLTGDLLDAGCGTGEHSLLAAAHGATALGVDVSRTAIDRAQAKGRERGLEARFQAGDILTMPLSQHGFDTVIDSGLFHVFDDDDRVHYVGVLAEALRPGGVLYLACFSDRQPGDWGPRRVAQQELYDAFAGWRVDHVQPVEFEINPMFDLTSTHAWLATIRAPG
jgi:SAM-dependent methyltransferase